MTNHDIVVIGASAGGIEALTRLISGIPGDFPGTLFIVLHIPAESPSYLPQILSRAGNLHASHARDQERFEKSRIYVAPPDHHLLLERGYMRVVRGPKENRHRPAIDPLFRSAARAYGARVVGVVLSGMLDDGTAGMIEIKRRGGVAIVQNPTEALYASMPQSVIEHTNTDYCLPLDEMGPLLVSLAHQPATEEEPEPATEALEKEVRVAEMETNVFNEQAQVGEPSVFSCPECGGVLWEIKNGDFVRFRCRVGHAFSAESVLAEQTETVDKALWNALKTLDEKVDLSRRLANQALERGNNYMAQRFLEQLREAENDARLLRHVLLHPPLEKQPAEVSGSNDGAQ